MFFYYSISASPSSSSSRSTTHVPPSISSPTTQFLPATPTQSLPVSRSVVYTYPKALWLVRRRLLFAPHCQPLRSEGHWSYTLSYSAGCSLVRLGSSKVRIPRSGPVSGVGHGGGRIPSGSRYHRVGQSRIVSSWKVWNGHPRFRPQRHHGKSGGSGSGYCDFRQSQPGSIFGRAAKETADSVPGGTKKQAFVLDVAVDDTPN
jgi:hypothetical protein